MGLFSGIGKIAKSVVGAVTGGGGFGSLLGAGLGFLGGERQNEANQNISSANNAMSIELANTQYQRRVKDLQKAGLNPMLAYMPGSGGGSGGAAVPPLNTPRMENSADAASRAGLNAMQTALLQSQIDTQRTQSDLNSANAVKALAERDETIARTPTHASHIALNQAQIRKIDPEIQYILSQSALSSVNYNKALTEIKQIITQGDLTKAQTQEALARAGLTTAQIDEVVPRILKLNAEISNIRANTGFQELKGLPGNLMKYLTGDESVSGTLPDEIGRSFSNSADKVKQHMRKTRKQYENMKGN